MRIEFAKAHYSKDSWETWHTAIVVHYGGRAIYCFENNTDAKLHRKPKYRRVIQEGEPLHVALDVPRPRGGLMGFFGKGRKAPSDYLLSIGVGGKQFTLAFDVASTLESWRLALQTVTVKLEENRQRRRERAERYLAAKARRAPKSGAKGGGSSRGGGEGGKRRRGLSSGWEEGVSGVGGEDWRLFFLVRRILPSYGTKGSIECGGGRNGVWVRLGNGEWVDGSGSGGVGFAVGGKKEGGGMSMAAIRQETFGDKCQLSVRVDVDGEEVEASGAVVEMEKLEFGRGGIVRLDVESGDDGVRVVEGLVLWWSWESVKKVLEEWGLDNGSEFVGGLGWKEGIGVLLAWAKSQQATIQSFRRWKSYLPLHTPALPPHTTSTSIPPTILSPTTPPFLGPWTCWSAKLSVLRNAKQARELLERRIVDRIEGAEGWEIAGREQSARVTGLVPHTARMQHLAHALVSASKSSTIWGQVIRELLPSPTTTPQCLSTSPMVQVASLLLTNLPPTPTSSTLCIHLHNSTFTPAFKTSTTTTRVRINSLASSTLSSLTPHQYRSLHSPYPLTAEQIARAPVQIVVEEKRSDGEEWDVVGRVEVALAWVILRQILFQASSRLWQVLASTTTTSSTPSSSSSSPPPIWIGLKAEGNGHNVLTPLDCGCIGFLHLTISFQTSTSPTQPKPSSPPLTPLQLSLPLPPDLPTGPLLIDDTLLLRVDKEDTPVLLRNPRISEQVEEFRRLSVGWKGPTRVDGSDEIDHIGEEGNNAGDEELEDSGGGGGGGEEEKEEEEEVSEEGEDVIGDDEEEGLGREESGYGGGGGAGEEEEGRLSAGEVRKRRSMMARKVVDALAGELGSRLAKVARGSVQIPGESEEDVRDMVGEDDKEFVEDWADGRTYDDEAGLSASLDPTAEVVLDDRLRPELFWLVVGLGNLYIGHGIGSGEGVMVRVRCGAAVYSTIPVAPRATLTINNTISLPLFFPLPFTQTPTPPSPTLLLRHTPGYLPSPQPPSTTISSTPPPATFPGLCSLSVGVLTTAQKSPRHAPVVSSLAWMHLPIHKITASIASTFPLYTCHPQDESLRDEMAVGTTVPTAFMGQLDVAACLYDRHGYHISRHSPTIPHPSSPSPQPDTASIPLPLPVPVPMPTPMGDDGGGGDVSMGMEMGTKVRMVRAPIFLNASLPPNPPMPETTPSTICLTLLSAFQVPEGRLIVKASIGTKKVKSQVHSAGEDGAVKLGAEELQIDADLPPTPPDLVVVMKWAEAKEKGEGVALATTRIALKFPLTPTILHLQFRPTQSYLTSKIEAKAPAFRIPTLACILTTTQSTLPPIPVSRELAEMAGLKSKERYGQEQHAISLLHDLHPPNHPQGRQALQNALHLLPLPPSPLTTTPADLAIAATSVLRRSGRGIEGGGGGGGGGGEGEGRKGYGESVPRRQRIGGDGVSGRIVGSRALAPPFDDVEGFELRVRVFGGRHFEFPGNESRRLSVVARLWVGDEPQMTERSPLTAHPWWDQILRSQLPHTSPAALPPLTIDLLDAHSQKTLASVVIPMTSSSLTDAWALLREKVEGMRRSGYGSTDVLPLDPRPVAPSPVWYPLFQDTTSSSSSSELAPKPEILVAVQCIPILRALPDIAFSPPFLSMPHPVALDFVLLDIQPVLSGAMMEAWENEEDVRLEVELTQQGKLIQSPRRTLKPIPQPPTSSSTSSSTSSTFLSSLIDSVRSTIFGKREKKVDVPKAVLTLLAATGKPPRSAQFAAELRDRMERSVDAKQVFARRESMSVEIPVLEQKLDASWEGKRSFALHPWGEQVVPRVEMRMLHGGGVKGGLWGVGGEREAVTTLASSSLPLPLHTLPYGPDTTAFDLPDPFRVLQRVQDARVIASSAGSAQRRHCHPTLIDGYDHVERIVETFGTLRPHSITQFRADLRPTLVRIVEQEKVRNEVLLIEAEADERRKEWREWRERQLESVQNCFERIADACAAGVARLRQQQQPQGGGGGGEGGGGGGGGGEESGDGEEEHQPYPQSPTPPPSRSPFGIGGHVEVEAEEGKVDDGEDVGAGAGVVEPGHDDVEREGGLVVEVEEGLNEKFWGTRMTAARRKELLVEVYNDWPPFMTDRRVLPCSILDILDPNPVIQEMPMYDRDGQVAAVARGFVGLSDPEPIDTTSNESASLMRLFRSKPRRKPGDLGTAATPSMSDGEEEEEGEGRGEEEKEEKEEEDEDEVEKEASPLALHEQEQSRGVRLPSGRFVPEYMLHIPPPPLYRTVLSLASEVQPVTIRVYVLASQFTFQHRFFASEEQKANNIVGPIPLLSEYLSSGDAKSAIREQERQQAVKEEALDVLDTIAWKYGRRPAGLGAETPATIEDLYRALEKAAEDEASYAAWAARLGMDPPVSLIPDGLLDRVRDLITKRGNGPVYPTLPPALKELIPPSGPIDSATLFRARPSRPLRSHRSVFLRAHLGPSVRAQTTGRRAVLVPRLGKTGLFGIKPPGADEDPVAEVDHFECIELKAPLPGPSLLCIEAWSQGPSVTPLSTSSSSSSHESGAGVRDGTSEESEEVDVEVEGVKLEGGFVEDIGEKWLHPDWHALRTNPASPSALQKVPVETKEWRDVNGRKCGRVQVWIDMLRSRSGEERAFPPLMVSPPPPVDLEVRVVVWRVRNVRGVSRAKEGWSPLFVRSWMHGDADYRLSQALRDGDGLERVRWPGEERTRAGYVLPAYEAEDLAMHLEVRGLRKNDFAAHAVHSTESTKPLEGLTMAERAEELMKQKKAREAAVIRRDELRAKAQAALARARDHVHLTPEQRRTEARRLRRLRAELKRQTDIVAGVAEREENPDGDDMHLALNWRAHFPIKYGRYGRLQVPGPLLLELCEGFADPDPEEEERLRHPSRCACINSSWAKQREARREISVGSNSTTPAKPPRWRSVATATVDITTAVQEAALHPLDPGGGAQTVIPSAEYHAVPYADFPMAWVPLTLREPIDMVKASRTSPTTPLSPSSPVSVKTMEKTKPAEILISVSVGPATSDKDWRTSDSVEPYLRNPLRILQQLQNRRRGWFHCFG